MIYLTCITLLTLAVVTLVILIQQGKQPIIVAILVPLIVLSIGFSWATIDDLKGRPIHSMPTPGSHIIGVKIIKPVIFLTVLNEDGARLHQIPWTPNNAKKAENASKLSKSGKRIIVAKPSNKDAKEDLNIKEFNITDEMRKDE